MIGTSTNDYLFIQACIYGLHYVAPLSISYCLIQILRYGLRPALSHRLPIALELWAAAEALFYFVVHIWYRQHLQAEIQHPPPVSRQGRRELFALCNQNISDPEAYLYKWFLGAPAESIKRDNLKEFFLWAFFNRDGPPGEDDEELEEYIGATERLLGRKVEDGRGSAVCLRLTLDPVKVLHRSILWYWCVGFVDFLTFCRLQYYGFHFHRTALSRFFTLFPLRPIALLSRHKSPVKYTTYWHRPHTSRTKLPIVFIHGIGIGLYPYVNFLRDLNSASGVEGGGFDDQVGIIAIEIMPVSFRITHSPLAKQEMCDEIQAIAEHHGFEKYVLVAHSYGTAVATYMLKNAPTAKQIGPVVLIDPITILLHLPDVAYNFTRRTPVEANEHQLYYFASMDMGVSHTLARSFFWSDVVLWKKDLGDRRVTCSLAQRDLIVNTEAVSRYLASSDYDVTDDRRYGSGSNDVTEDERGSDDADGNGYAESNGNGYVDAHCNGYAKSNGHEYADCNGHAKSNGNGYVHGDTYGYADSNGNEYGEHNDQTGPGPTSNGNGFLSPTRHLSNGHARSRNGHIKPDSPKTDYLPSDEHWKTRPWRGQGLDILWQHGIDHAQVFDSAKRRKRLISAIRAYSRQPAEE